MVGSVGSSVIQSVVSGAWLASATVVCPFNPIMTTEDTHYLVAYPHPSISPPGERIQRFELASNTDGKALLGMIRDAFPNHSSDLKHGTLWKVSRSPVAQLLP